MEKRIENLEKIIQSSNMTMKNILASNIPNDSKLDLINDYLNAVSTRENPAANVNIEGNP